MKAKPKTNNRKKFTKSPKGKGHKHDANFGPELQLQLQAGRFLLKNGKLFCSMPVGPYKSAFFLVRRRDFYHKGYPDMFIPFPSKGKAGWFVEFKANAQSNITTDQIACLSRLKSLGYKTSVIHSLKQFKEIAIKYLKIKK